MKFIKKHIIRILVCFKENFVVVFFCIIKIIDFQSMCLQFINALLAQTDDFEFRMHLRNEIVRNGLFDKLGEFEILYCKIKKNIFFPLYFV